MIIVSLHYTLSFLHSIYLSLLVSIYQGLVNPKPFTSLTSIYTYLANNMELSLIWAKVCGISDPLRHSYEIDLA